MFVPLMDRWKMCIPKALTRMFILWTALAHLLISQAALAYNTTLVQLGAEETGSKCWQYIRLNGGLIFSHSGLDGYTDDTDCKVTLITDPGKRIYLRFESFDIADSINCYQDEVIVYDGRHYASLKLSGAPYGLCGSPVDKRYREMRSTGNEVTVRFITDDIRTKNKGFVIVFASFDPEEESSIQGDSASCFTCEDGSMCIDNQLVCDQLWHCLDGSDEGYHLCYADPTENPKKSSSKWLTWMGTFFAIIVAVIITVFVILSLVACCCCRDKTTDAVRADPNYVGRMAPGCNSSDELDSGQSSCSSQNSVEIGRAYSSCTGTSSEQNAGSTKLLYGYTPNHHPQNSTHHYNSNQRHLTSMYSFNPPTEYSSNHFDQKLRDCYSNFSDRTVAYHSGQVALPPEIGCR